jgi:alginate O-acetyltransferase complex protein AlgI
MLFNSFTFIFIFLPVTLAGFYLFSKTGRKWVVMAWLTGASLFFYGWWNPLYLVLILASILVNYGVGVALGSSDRPTTRLWLMIFGIAANLSLLGYYKYANFFVDNLNLALGSNFHLDTIILPLAISFYTFQQIAYVVDSYKSEAREFNLLRYGLFVSFFPQLIAGPIVHHKEILPQFVKDSGLRVKYEHLAIGLTIFAIGLFKKVVVADGIAVYATPVFTAVETGMTVTLFEAWGGLLAYYVQLYFDFSGYSDMAIGLARMFGVRLPLNFNSPYKARNIIEFWRRWHITLGRFITSYLFTPISIALFRHSILAGHGALRQFLFSIAIPSVVTFFLVGLWHGAGWNFVIFGLLHGFYFVLTHAWHQFRRYVLKQKKIRPTAWGILAARLGTTLALLLSLVFFRTESFGGAIRLVDSLIGLQGVALPTTYLGYLNVFGNLGDLLAAHGVAFSKAVLFKGITQIGWLALLILFAWFAPNTQQIMFDYRPALETYPGEVSKSRSEWALWRPNIVSALAISGLLIWALTHQRRVSEFLYFQF